MSDVVEKVKEARAADEKMREIAENAQAFAASDLTDAMMSAYIEALLTSYAGLLRFRNPMRRDAASPAEQRPLSQWMYDQIDEQLAPHRGRGISREWLDGVAEAYAPRYAENFVRFIIRAGRLSWRAQEDRFPAYNKARFAVMRDAIAAIALDLPDLEFELYLSDGFTGWSRSSAAPLFAFSKHAAKDGAVILIPDSVSLRNSGGVRRQVEEASHSRPWAAKVEKCFWRGSTNGRFNLKQYQLTPRFRLVQAGLDNPDEIDAAFTSVEHSDKRVQEIIEGAGLLKRHAPLADHLAFKYLALVDGFAPAWSRNFWNFHTNSVIFKQRSDLIMWFDRGVREYVHFVPIESDMSDVAEKVREARRNDAGMRQIAENAQAFAESDLTDAMMSGYLKELLTRYGEIFKA
jgi:hypothetical protein